jgi:predicted FMN-binding regulatory protein PaiB
VSITRMEGKWKMSQNRAAEDIQGVVDGLASAPSGTEREVGSIVASRQR